MEETDHIKAAHALTSSTLPLRVPGDQAPSDRKSCNPASGASDGILWKRDVRTAFIIPSHRISLDLHFEFGAASDKNERGSLNSQLHPIHTRSHVLEPIKSSVTSVQHSSVSLHRYSTPARDVARYRSLLAARQGAAGSSRVRQSSWRPANASNNYRTLFSRSSCLWAGLMTTRSWRRSSPLALGLHHSHS